MSYYFELKLDGRALVFADGPTGALPETLASPAEALELLRKWLEDAKQTEDLEQLMAWARTRWPEPS